ncbi:MAG: hypothetical protein WBW26_00550, partial [Bradyrhizobium sp.]
ANRIVFMDAGQIIETNTPANFFANPQHARTKLFNPDFMRSKNLPAPAWLEKRSKIDVPFAKT